MENQMSDGPSLWLNSEKLTQLTKQLSCEQLGALLLLAVENCQKGHVTKWDMRKCPDAIVKRMFVPIAGERYTLPWLADLIQAGNPYAVAPKENELGGDPA